jgi:hypothetical protein
MAGRKTKLTPELQEEVVKRIRAGNYIQVACEAVGISHTTYFNWIKKGEEGKRPYVEFLEAVKKAESEAQVNYVATVASHARDQWQAAAWWLERRFPDKWGRKDRLDIKGEITAEKKVDKIEEKFAHMSESELNQHVFKLSEKMLYGGTIEEKKKAKDR